MPNPFQIVSTPTLVKDPVCGMMIDPAKAPGTLDYAGEHYSFCNLGCMVKFRAEPERYLHPEQAPGPTPKPGVEYTCPMHPDVVQKGPGSCPYCGMALEPMTFTAGGDEANPELDDMTRRFKISLAFTIPLFALAMAGMFFARAPWLNWVELILATPVVVWGGKPFFERAWSSLRMRSPNMFTLIGIGTGAA